MIASLVSRLTPIGLDIGAQWIKAVQLRVTRGGGRRVVAASRFARSAGLAANGAPDVAPDSAECRRIGEVLARQGFIGRRVVIGTPAARQLVAPVRLPPAGSGAPLGLIARAQLAESGRCDADSLLAAWWPLPEPARTAGQPGQPGDAPISALAVGAMLRDVDSAIDQLEAGGLEVAACDAEVSAIARACEPLLESPPSVSAVLSLGFRSASLSVLCGDTPVYHRLLPDLAVGLLQASLCESLKIEHDIAGYVLTETGAASEPAGPGGAGEPAAQRWEGALDARELVRRAVATMAQEIRVSLSYTAGQHPGSETARVLVIGGGAMIPGLPGVLAEETGLAARRVSLRDLAHCPPELAGLAGDAGLVAACGMALDGVAPSGLGSCAGSASGGGR